MTEGKARVEPEVNIPRQTSTTIHICAIKNFLSVQVNLSFLSLFYQLQTIVSDFG